MTIPDKDGNTIVTIPKGDTIQVFLRLIGEARPRSIGTIHCPTRTLHIKRKRAKHLFRKFNAYGFCYQLLHDAKRFDKIHLSDEQEEWNIPVSFILDKENASFLHFSGVGFELQVFTPLTVIEKFKI